MFSVFEWFVLALKALCPGQGQIWAFLSTQGQVTCLALSWIGSD